ncbi:I78 family peptidase inhibitor [Bordetella petrii]|uniref:I78 family peptidase inhibitor n=1 Tax=Bordetella petrii TaxID=94624 RepID=UPI001E46E498|nr:I78 family peptidase inhibitor [Bordetella petrii]MCD0505683.1 hypothetical protein [Bordetella petrii]
MIRKLIPVFLVAGLAACGTSGTQRGASDTSATGTTGAASSATPAQDCNAQPVQNLVGQAYSDSVGKDAQSASQSTQLRVLRPGQVMTMEYNPARLNIILDASGNISALRCG